MSDKTIFDYLNNIYYKQGLKYDKKISPSYLISLWLSHDRSLLELTDAINEFQFLLPDEVVYQYYYYKVPRGKRYIRWVKKEELDKKKKDTMDKVRKESLLSKKEFDKYKMFFSVEEKEKPIKQKKVMFFN